MQQDQGYQQEKKTKISLGQRWHQAQPTKTVLFWSCAAAMVVTMIIGFSWGGWMTGGSARKMSEKMVREAVVNRLAPLCVNQFQQDPGKIQKLAELKAANTWTRGEYVEKQGWATIAGEEKPDKQVAKECANLLLQLNQSTSLLQ